MTDGARVLIVGGGGRSHALGALIAQSPGVSKVVFAPGTSGLEYLGYETAPVASQDLPGLVELAEMEEFDEQRLHLPKIEQRRRKGSPMGDLIFLEGIMGAKGSQRPFSGSLLPVNDALRYKKV